MTVYNVEAKNYTISGKNNYAWSASKKVFYLIADLLLYIRNNNWPTDAVEVSDDVFSEFSSFQNGDGKIRGVGEDGMPAWVDIPEPTAEDKVSVAILQKQKLIEQANIKIQLLQDAEELGIATDDESERLIAWKKYRVQLNRVNTALAPNIQWPAVPEGI